MNNTQVSNVNRLIWTMTTVLFGLVGATLGWSLGNYYAQMKVAGAALAGKPIGNVVVGVFIIGLAIVMARLGSWLADRYVIPWLRRMHQLSAADRVLGIIGVLLGVMFGVLVTQPLQGGQLGVPFLPIRFCVMAISGVLGVALLQGMRAEMLRVFPQLDAAAAVENSGGATPKLLDTNVIIDGRMADLCKTGFIEGPLIVPHFVLEEVQYIADSADSMRRARGRRGLEVLNVMREFTMNGSKINSSGSAETVPLVRVMNDIPASVQKIDTVDSKLVFLAKELKASIVTNDFNLNRVAEMQGVQVLNINELAQALKPVVLPGEEMNLTIVKEGKEAGQGVGYLEDGTMVVVGDGNKHVGETCKVVISSVYQTLAGKMIFAELKGMKGAGDDLFSNGTQRGSDKSGEKSDDFSHRPGGGVRRKGKP